jgi:F5/8 type C domain/Glycosyl hydrolases family 43
VRTVKFYVKSLMLFLVLSMVPGISITTQAAYVTIHNDFFWYDTSGNLIQVRSGCLRKFGDLYYWYGSLPGAIDQTCYTSSDLVHWAYKGVVLHAAIDANRMDVLYNDSTKKYVMFLKYNGNAAYLGIATATAPDGQFTFLSQILVGGAKIGDMSMYKDDDGKAYLAYVWDSTGSNRQHGIYLMSADYLTLDKRIYLWDIHSREAPHIFKRNGTYYYGVSETNGIQPSPTRYYMATDLSGPWSAATMLVTPGSSTTYETQCDFVFPFTGAQGTVYMLDADRWIPTGGFQGDYLWLPYDFNTAGAPTANYYQDWDLNPTTGTWRAFDRTTRDLALGKTATASSTNGANAATGVTTVTTYQNYTATRWESSASDPQWIMVDLGAAKDINRVILKWYTDYAKAFQIQVSTNSTTWTDVYSTTKGASYSVTDVTFAKTSARYVRMNGTQRGTTNGYSLFAFMVLNDTSATPTTFKTEKQTAPAGTFLKCQNNTIHYSIPFGNSVKLEAFDAQGKLAAVLVDGFQSAGNHDAAVPAKLSKGLYVFRLTASAERIVSIRIRL